MPERLLSTKLHPPARATRLLAREQLQALRDQSRQAVLTLVAAPAGYGKSTLVAGWLFGKDGGGGKQDAIAWLTLDTGDNDPLRFWRYVVAALHGAVSTIGAEAAELLRAGAGNPEAVISSLINDMAGQEAEVILVLDDCHVIEAPPIHAGLQFLLDHQPAGLRLVLISRSDPPLRLARLRAQGRLCEIRADALQCTTAEVYTLLNEQFQLDLAPDQIAQILQRSEGWMSGVQLLGLALREQADRMTFLQQFNGSHQFILDYLVEEVLHGLPAPQQRFLLYTALLDRFCADLCAAVTDTANSQDLLDDLRARQLFLMPLDTSGQWFRYHQLFAECLRALLTRREPAIIATLHRRAAGWYAQQGLIDEAVSHSLRNDDSAFSRELILQHWAPTVHQGYVATVLRWLDALPAAADDPALALARCWTLHLGGQTLAMAPFLTLLDTALAGTPIGSGRDAPAQPAMAAQLAMLRSVLARAGGEHGAALIQAEAAVQLAPPQALDLTGPAWNLLAAARIGTGDISGGIAAFEQGIDLAYRAGNLLSAAVSLFGQAMYLLHQGQLHRAESRCRALLEQVAVDAQADAPAIGLVHVALARIELERLHLDAAEQHLAEGRRLAAGQGFSEMLRFGRYTQARLATARGDFATAADLLAEAERLVRALADPQLPGEIEREWLEYALAAGDPVLAEQHLPLLEAAAAATGRADLQLAVDWAGSRLACHHRRYADALARLEPALARTRVADSHGASIKLLAVQAVAQAGQGQTTAAHDTLLAALELAAPAGFVQRWLDAGPELGTLLAELPSSHVASPLQPYLDTLRATCRLAYPAPVATQRIPALDALSAREIDVLRLIAAGASNQQIAAELQVTLHTVKKHSSNIYNKLSVTSRTQALVCARERGLIP